VKRSPIQVEDYLLKELSFKVNEEYDSDKPEDTSGAIQYMIEVRKHKEDPYKWQCILGVRSNPGVKGNTPYTFTVVLEGYFAVDSKVSDEVEREKLVNANTPALLYTIAREILSSTSARARWGRINLPTVYFPAVTSAEIKEEKYGRKLSSKKPASTKEKTKTAHRG
jgi:preprotein translocase subunit SecB